MTIATEFSVAANGDIRHVSGTTNYTVIAFHRWLGDLSDQAAASGDDVLDITDSTASERATDNYVTLKAPFNIDDTAAQFVYDGSIVQKGGDEIYDGLVIISNAGTPLEIVQNGAKATNFWGTTYNADAPNGISHRFMLKVRTAGADIDGRRLLAQTRSFGYSYSEFKINGTARGNNVAALTYALDLNNGTAVGTVAGWTTIANTEGYRTLDIDGDGTSEYYYSEWDRDTYSMNQFYERMKWLTRAGSSSTIYGLNGELFRGITHELTMTTPRSGTFNATEKVTWPGGGEGWMFAVNVPAASTKMYIQVTKGTAPAGGVLITGFSSSATGTTSGTATEHTLSFPWCGVSTGSALLGSYGFGMQTTDVSASDRIKALDDVVYTPPNNQNFTVNGLNITGDPDRVLVAPLGYMFAYDTEVSGPFTLGENLTFGTPVGTGVLCEIQDEGATGYMVIRHTGGTLPTDNTTIAGDSSSATAAVNGAVNAFIDVRQFTLSGALTTAGVTTVTVNEAIPQDTPATGVIRIKRADSVYTNHTYSARNIVAKTFTIGSTDFSSNNAPASSNTYIGYIDKAAASASESVSMRFASNRNLFVRVRNGGASPIKTFETTATFTSSGGSATAIRTSDT